MAKYVGLRTSHKKGYKMASAIRKFNVNLFDAVAAFEDARVMCPVHLLGYLLCFFHKNHFKRSSAEHEQNKRTQKRIHI